MTKPIAPETTPAEEIGAILEEYAKKGVFRSFSAKTRGGKGTYRMLWHYERMFECEFDKSRETFRFPVLLPNVPADSDMHKNLKAFVQSRQDGPLPEHRRILPEKTQVKVFNRNSAIALNFKVLDGDYAYTARRAINLVHEIFLDFLQTGRTTNIWSRCWG